MLIEMQWVVNFVFLYLLLDGTIDQVIMSKFYKRLTLRWSYHEKKL